MQNEIREMQGLLSDLCSVNLLLSVEQRLHSCNKAFKVIFSKLGLCTLLESTLKSLSR